VFIVTGLSVGFGLAVVIVGFPILIVTLLAWLFFARLERELAIHLLGATIRPMSVPDPVKRTRWERLLKTLADPVTWKSLVYVFLEFPFGLIIFIVSAVSHVAKQLNSKPALAIAHSPGLTRGYQLDSYQTTGLQNYLSPEVCQDIISYVHKKKRFLMVQQEWLLLASHKKEIAPGKLGELVADALRLTDVLERAKGIQK